MLLKTNKVTDSFSITNVNDTDIFTFTLQYLYLYKLKELVEKDNGIELWKLLGSMLKQITPYTASNINRDPLHIKQISDFLNKNELDIKTSMYNALAKIAKEKYKLILNIPNKPKVFNTEIGSSQINVMLNIYFVSDESRSSYILSGFNVLTIGYVKEGNERRVFNLNKISSKSQSC